MNFLEVVLIVVIGFLIGLIGFGFLLHRRKITQAVETAKLESQKLIEKTHKEADRIIKSALQESKEDAKKRRRTFEEEAKKRRSEINKLEQQYKNKEREVSEMQDAMLRREKKARELEQKLILDEKNNLKLKAEYELSIEKNQKVLEKLSHMSAFEAKKKLMETLEQVAKRESFKEIKRIEQEARNEGMKKARTIISLAVQKLASDYVNDSSVTVVQLPGEEMKGRIIGREGRNIRAIEQCIGVDLIIDDTPEAVIISSFNPIRREVAKLTIEKLIADGRIHPARIEETSKRVESELDITIKEYGDQAAFDVGVTDLHPSLLSLLGKLRFRSVGMQSILQHSVETANICGIIAGELGLDVKKAKRAGLLHDIGKAIDEETEGDHATIGANICKQYEEDEEIVTAIALHHTDQLKSVSPLAVILGAANTLSSNRPGARKELLASYIKRLERMESLILSFPNVTTAYVLQSGREVRVLVEPTEMTDYDVQELTDAIAKKLRQELTFPGQVRITTIKENKQIEFAS